MSTQKAEGPRGGGGGGGRDKTQPTPTELLALADRIENWDCIRFQDIEGWAKELRTIATTLSAREDGWQLVPMIGAMVKADHPTTCLNPDEFFEVIAVEVDSLGARARGENTCWFGISLLTAAPKAPTAGEGTTR